MALTKAEMAERLYEEVGLNKREAKEIVELFFDERLIVPDESLSLMQGAPAAQSLMERFSPF